MVERFLDTEEATSPILVAGTNQKRALEEPFGASSARRFFIIIMVIPINKMG